MKIKLLKEICCGLGVFGKGEEVDLPDEMAKGLLDSDLAVSIPEPQRAILPKVVKSETAETKQPSRSGRWFGGLGKD